MNTIAIISHYPTIDVGMPVPITIEVEGDKALCKCKHKEKGTFQHGIPPEVDSFDKEYPIPCGSYTDMPGIVPLQPFPPGVPWNGQEDTFHFVYDLTIVVECAGSDGAKIQGSGIVRGDFWFKVRYNPEGATPIPTGLRQ